MLNPLYTDIKYIWFGFVLFYGISTILEYLMPKPLYTYILNIVILQTNFVDTIYQPLGQDMTQGQFLSGV